MQFLSNKLEHFVNALCTVELTNVLNILHQRDKKLTIILNYSLNNMEIRYHSKLRASITCLISYND